MRWSSLSYIRTLLVFVAIFTLNSCNKKADEERTIVSSKAQVPLPKIEETFPFSEAEKIEIISYPVRRNWDTITNDKGRWGVINIVKDKKLQVNPKGIKDRIILNDNLKDKLFKAIYTLYEPSETAACFDPRHAVLFYNKKSEIIAYIEICFHCGTYKFSDNFKHGSFNVGTLRQVFKDAGIKYFGEDEK